MTSDERIELNALLHKLWTRDVGRDGYEKRDWVRLEVLLLKASVERDRCKKIVDEVVAEIRKNGGHGIDYYPVLIGKRISGEL